MLTQRNRLSLAIIGFAYLIWFISHAGEKPGVVPNHDTRTMNEMAGTWTDPKGPAGNHLSFEWIKIKDAPGDPLALISAVFDTKGEVENLLDLPKTAFTFGFYSHDPDAVSFLNLGGREQMLLKLKARDHTHMTVQVLSRHYDKQKEELSKPPVEPPVELVRLKEPSHRPNY
jgi:hypothetical protein